MLFVVCNLLRYSHNIAQNASPFVILKFKLVRDGKRTGHLALRSFFSTHKIMTLRKRIKVQDNTRQ